MNAVLRSAPAPLQARWLLRLAPVAIAIAASMLGSWVEGSAWAQPSQGPSEFDKRVQEGMERYNGGDYAKAVEAFEAAYALDPRPELIYNVARSYEKALLRDEAITAYERFVELPGTTAALRTKALDSLTALRRERQALARASAATRDPSPAPLPPRAAASALSEPARPGIDRTLEWALIGGGAAIAGAGLVFGILALDSQSKLDEAQSPTNPNRDLNQLESLSDETETRALVADVLFGVGAASALTGIVLFLARGDKGGNVTLTPALHSGGGLVLSGSF